MAQFNQLILDNMARGAAKEGERRANVGNPNQRLVWRGGKWEDDGQATPGTNQLIADNIARGAAKEGEYRTNVGDPNQRLQYRKDASGVLGWQDAGPSGAMSPSGGQVSYKSASAGGAAQQPQQQAAGIMSQPASFVSQLQNIENPFGANYQAQLQGQATSNAARQYQQAANRTRALLASRGLMSGGGTGLEAQMLNQAYSESMGNRDRILSEALTNTADRRADFEFRRAQGLMSAAEMDALLPSRKKQAESQADVASRTVESDIMSKDAAAREAAAGARVAEQTETANIRRIVSNADLANLQVESQNLANELQRYTPEQQAQIRNSFVQQALAKGLVDERGANLILQETDPTKWWNHEGWRAAKGTMNFLKDLSEIFGNVAGGVKNMFGAGSVGK